MIIENDKSFFEISGRNKAKCGFRGSPMTGSNLKVKYIIHI